MSFSSQINKLGNGTGIRLNQKLLKESKFKTDDEIEIKVLGEGKSLIEKKEKINSIYVLFEGYENPYTREEMLSEFVDFGEDVGHEIID